MENSALLHIDPEKQQTRTLSVVVLQNNTQATTAATKFETFWNLSCTPPNLGKKEKQKNKYRRRYFLVFPKKNTSGKKIEMKYLKQFLACLFVCLLCLAVGRLRRAEADYAYQISLRDQALEEHRETLLDWSNLFLNRLTDAVDSISESIDEIRKTTGNVHRLIGHVFDGYYYDLHMTESWKFIKSSGYLLWSIRQSMDLERSSITSLESVPRGGGCLLTSSFFA